ncbi:hypothetical protein TNCV_427801 [Trichonephila clavipes]|nr:hypothetical protein TNCV_427801 [Trichonephila clavipes]
MYRNPVTSEYILDFKKCPIEVSDEWSRDLKSVQVQKQLSCRAERLETEQRQKLEQQEQLSIEKLRLEIELSRIANQNNGQTSRVKSLDEIVKMVSS